MSDLSIPGVTDKYNTQKIIDGLMALKKQPLTRMQKDLRPSSRRRPSGRTSRASSGACATRHAPCSASRTPSTTVSLLLRRSRADGDSHASGHRGNKEITSDAGRNR